MMMLVFALIGVFTICGAVFDWDFFMNDRKARFFVWILGRNGARVFYGLLGTAFVIGGIVGAINGA